MYAIIETGGKQYRVQKDDVIDVELLETGKGDKIEFKHVLFFNDGKASKVGAPYVANSTVIGEIVG
jgi:large subunit ribosomal protein L21